MTYAARWSCFWSVVGAIAVGASFLVWKPASVAALFLSATLCAGVVLSLAAPASGQVAAGQDAPTEPPTWRRIVGRASVVGAVVVAVGACTVIAPYLALPLVLIAVASSPGVIDRFVHWRRLRKASTRLGDAATATPHLVVDGVGPEGPAPDRSDFWPEEWPGPADSRLDMSDAEVEGLTDPELCLRWRRSFVTLQSARSRSQLIRVVVQRQQLLDEMERRSPSALQAWLASGARAAGGPERFLTDDRPEGRSDVA
jgi:hypothetical protein